MHQFVLGATSWEAALWKRTLRCCGHQVDIEPEMCPCHKKRLHQTKYCQQVKGDDLSPLLSSGKATLGILCPVLDSPVQMDRLERVLQRDMKMIKGQEREAEIAETFQARENKALEGMHQSAQISKERMHRGQSQGLSNGAQQQDKGQQAQSGTKEALIELQEMDSSE